jgi:peptide/nickel transport system substrate-binding protein
MAEVYAEPDERVRQIKVKLMTREILDKAPYIFLPTRMSTPPGGRG